MLDVWIFILVGFPTNRLAWTIVISAGLSSKLASPLITLGPVATLAVEGVEKSRMNLSTMGELGSDRIWEKNNKLLSITKKNLANKFSLINSMQLSFLGMAPEMLVDIS
jgi:hypothetical protein